MREDSDPGNQLQWLITTLKSLETTNAKAWIIGNIHPGSKYCNSKWARRYNILIEKY